MHTFGPSPGHAVCLGVKHLACLRYYAAFTSEHLLRQRREALGVLSTDVVTAKQRSCSLDGASEICGRGPVTEMMPPES